MKLASVNQAVDRFYNFMFFSPLGGCPSSEVVDDDTTVGGDDDDISGDDDTTVADDDTAGDDDSAEPGVCVERWNINISAWTEPLLTDLDGDGVSDGGGGNWR